jgi:hypothetical protein
MSTFANWNLPPSPSDEHRAMAGQARKRSIRGAVSEHFMQGLGKEL